MNIRLLILLCVTSQTVHAVSVEQAYLDLGQALQNENNHHEAIDAYQHLLKRMPTHAQALQHLATLYMTTGNYDDAHLSLTQLTTHNPNNADGYILLAQLHAYRNNRQQTEQTGYTAITHAPTSWNMHHRYATLLQQIGNYTAAHFHYQMAQLLNPSHTPLYTQCAEMLMAQKKYSEAAELYEKAYLLTRSNTQLQLHQARALVYAGTTHQALTIYQELLAKHPDNTELLHHIAYAYAHSGNWHEAQTWYEKIPTKNDPTRIGYAHTLLALGNLQQGFEHLAEKTVPGLPNAHILRSPHQVAQKIVVLGASWDYSDMVHLVRYAQLLQRYGAAKVIVQAPQDLVPLLRLCRHINTVVDCNEPLPAHHWYLPLFNAPHIFKTTLDTVPTTTTYLQPPKAMVEQWHSCCTASADTQLKVGLYLHNDEDKTPNETQATNIPLSALAPFADMRHIAWYLLSPMPTVDNNRLPASCIVHHTGSGFTYQGQDLVQLAALISTLDLVITKDCIVAHIAGALGKPVFVLLPTVAHWRWMTERSDSPWYPTMRLFRQTTAGDWSTVIEQIKNTLFTFKQ